MDENGTHGPRFGARIPKQLTDNAAVMSEDSLSWMGEGRGEGESLYGLIRTLRYPDAEATNR